MTAVHKSSPAVTTPAPPLHRKLPTKWISGVLFRGIKQSQHAVGHPPGATIEIKNVWRCTLAIPLYLHGVLENILSLKIAVIVVKILGVVVQNITIRGPGILCTLVLQDAIIEGGKGKGKAVPLQAWTGPEGSRNLRFPDFVTPAQDDGMVVSHTHRPPLPPGNTTGIYLCERLSRTQGHSAIGRNLCQ